MGRHILVASSKLIYETHIDSYLKRLEQFRAFVAAVRGYCGCAARSTSVVLLTMSSKIALNTAFRFRTLNPLPYRLTLA